jgi:hypothetical protein
MRIVKQRGHRLFTQDPETGRVVSEMLSYLRVRRKRYVQRTNFKS